jgi:hypothetical protein
MFWRSILILSSHLCHDLPSGLPSMPWPSKWSPSFRFRHQNPACLSLLAHACYIPQKWTEITTSVNCPHQYTTIANTASVLWSIF